MGLNLYRRSQRRADGLLPTEKRIEFDGIYIYRFKNGKLVERSGKRDMFKLMSQLGAGSPSK